MRTIFLLLISLFCLSVNAQTILGQAGNESARLTEVKLVDTSILECVYTYKIYDTKLDESKEYFKILEIGDKYSKFSCYGIYRVDSIISADYPNGLTFSEYARLSGSFRPTSTDYIMKDLKSGTIQLYDKIFTDRFAYEEPIVKIDWKLEAGTRIVCGYNCRQATAVFRGRKWTAWYCDVPLSNGPWKFGGLPGLILRIEDESKEHLFEAISLRKSNKQFGYKKQNYVKTTREKFNKAVAEYYENPGTFITGSPHAPRDANGNIVTSKSKLFFNPIEKE